MADLASIIDDIVQGDDCYITRDVESVPAGHYLTDAWFSIKENHWDTNVIFTKHITAVLSADGQITDTGVGDTLATVQFIISGADTVDLHPFYKYTFDLQVKSTNGSATKIYTPEYGTIVFNPQITTGE